MLYDDLVNTSKGKWYTDKGRGVHEVYFFGNGFIPEDQTTMLPYFEGIKFFQGREPVRTKMSLSTSRYQKSIPAKKVPRNFRKQLADILKSGKVRYDLDTL